MFKYLVINQTSRWIFCCLLPPGGRCGAQHVPQIGDRSAGAREYEPRAGKAVHSSRPTATKHILVYRALKKNIGNIFDVQCECLILFMKNKKYKSQSPLTQILA